MNKSSKVLSGIILPFALLSSMLVPANNAIASDWIPPNDTRFNEQWNLSQMDIPKIWERTTGKGQIVAVLDSGYIPHPDLEPNMLKGYDFISNKDLARDENGRDNNAKDQGDWCDNWISEEYSTSSSWHGTHVAGIIAAVKGNDIGIAGVAPDVKILPVRVYGGACGSMDDQDLADAITWSAGGYVENVDENPTPATVINMSLHSNNKDEVCAPSIQEAINFAMSKNIPVVTISGNYALEEGTSATSRPGNCNNVINVGASNSDKLITTYSNRGEEVDIIAPGGGPDARNPGQTDFLKILSTGNSGIRTPAYYGDDSSNGSYYATQGTSQAAPLVAGVVAMMRSINPALTPKEIEDLITNSATPMDCSQCGAGLINPTSIFEEGIVIQAPEVEINGLENGYPIVGYELGLKYSGTWNPSSVALFYQWQRSGVDIPNATSSRYTVSNDDVEKLITVKVTAMKLNSEKISIVSAPSKKAIFRDEIWPVDSPSLEGETKTGSVLTVKLGQPWYPAPVNMSYQWYRGSTSNQSSETMEKIVGADSQSYTLAKADEGKFVRAVVSGSKYGYITANYLVQTEQHIPVSTGISASKPTISGNAKVGSALTAVHENWGDGVSIAYQWNVSGQPITGANGSSYTVKTGDFGKAISLTITGSKPGIVVQRTSDPTALVLKGSLETKPATITGTPKVGHRLNVTHDAWGPTPVAMSYQWYRSGVAITGATANSYLLIGDDHTKNISVRVIGRKEGYVAVYRQSPNTVAISPGDLKGEFPKITGNTIVGSTLAANPGLWTAGTTVSYQWYRNGVAITGSTGRYYALTETDRGTQIKVRVLGKKTGYTSRAYYSYSTVPIS